MVTAPLLSHPLPTTRTGSSRGGASPQRLTLAALLAVYTVGVLPQPADAAFECRIKKSITSGYYYDGKNNYGNMFGESYPAHIYATVASTGCNADATALSSRAAAAAALRCSTQTNLPASTNSGWSRTSAGRTGTITPSVAMSFATLGANLVDEDFWCYGNSGSASGSQAYWRGGTTCGSAPTGVPALLAPANTSCAVTAARLNEVIGSGVDFYCDGYIGFLQLRDCPDKIGILNDFVAGASTTTPTAAPTAAPSAAPAHCDMVRDGGEHVDTNSRAFCETAFATGLCDGAAVYASCNFTCTGCTAAPTVSPTVAAAPTSSVEGLVAAVAALVSQVATLNSSLTATRTDLARVQACNDAGQLYSSSTDTCASPSSGSSDTAGRPGPPGPPGSPGPPGPPGPQTIPADLTDSVAALESAVAEVVACSTAGQLYSSSTDTCEDPPQPSSSPAECVRPACGEGTQAEGGECIPDCDDLRRRSLDCHPFCAPTEATEAPPHSTSNDSGEDADNGDYLGFIIGGTVMGAVILVMAIATIRQRAQREPLPQVVPPVNNPAFAEPEYATMNYDEMGHVVPARRRLDEDYYVVGSNQMGGQLNYDEMGHVVPARKRLDEDDYVVGLEPDGRAAERVLNALYVEPTPVGTHA